MSKTAVIESFDRIAQYSTGGWNHNNHYHCYLLSQLPQGRSAALDIGSGLGEFSRLLAGYFTLVEGIDFSPRMVELAAARSASYSNIRYTCADFQEAEYPQESFDCVASIATLHHLPLRETLERIKSLLKPGGRLLILDLYRARTPLYYLFCAAGVIANPFMKMTRAGHNSEELRKAWAEHGPLDRYLSIQEIKIASQEVLPQARLRWHIYFRYSLIWEK